VAEAACARARRPPRDGHSAASASRRPRQVGASTQSLAPRRRMRVARHKRRPSHRRGHAQPPGCRGCAPAVDTCVHARRPAGHPRVRRPDEITGVVDWFEAGQGDALYDLATLTLNSAPRLNRFVRLLRSLWSRRGGRCAFSAPHRSRPPCGMSLMHQPEVAAPNLSWNHDQGLLRRRIGCEWRPDVKPGAAVGYGPASAGSDLPVCAALRSGCCGLSLCWPGAAVRAAGGSRPAPQ
jgi:hypothetical protein